MAREMTNKVYELMDEGVLSPRAVAEACLRWMSEDDVRRCGDLNGWFYEDEDEDEDEGYSNRKPNPRTPALPKGFVLFDTHDDSPFRYTLLHTVPLSYRGDPFYLFVRFGDGAEVPISSAWHEDDFQLLKRGGYRSIGRKIKASDLPRRLAPTLARYIAEFRARHGR